MRGMKLDDLLAIMDFLYCGEANVYQENLDSFLAIAEELQLQGFMGNTAKDEVMQSDTSQMTAQKKVKPSHKNVLKSEGTSQPNFAEEIQSNAVGGEVATLANYFPPGELLQELDEKCLSMMEKTSGKNARGQLIYRCKVCGKEEINGGMKNHIETNHLEGISIPCELCEKTFRSRNSLAKNTWCVYHWSRDKHTQRQDESIFILFVSGPDSL